MASFTDKTQTFNPYVAQLPVEAMVQVGMQKQAQYDAGVQKIQGYIDNIAGMDVANDADKAYLQSKLNDLGGKLKIVAAGDFSNQQLVNSVGGMATGIVKDKVVQNAVQSTAWYRKQTALMEKAVQDGKSSLANQHDFVTKASEWLSSKTPGQLFNYSYKQYIDVDKKLRDVAKDIHESDSTIEIPYKMVNGQVITGKDGKPIVDEAMLAIKTKGKSAEKILSAFYNGLSEDDVEQLKINANYHYRGASIDTFKSDLTSNFENKKKMISDEIVDLTTKLQNPKLSQSDNIAYTAKLNDLIAQRDNKTLDKDYNDQMIKLNNITSPEELDRLKHNIYNQKYLNGLAKDLSWQSYDQEYKTNPYFQANMDLKRLNLEYDKLRQSERHWSADYAQKERFHADEQAGKKGLTPIVTPDAIGTDVKLPTLADIDGKIEGANKSLATLDAERAPVIFSDAKYKSYTPAEKKKLLDQWTNDYKINPGMRIDDNNLRKYLEQRRALEIGKAQDINLRNYVTNETKAFDEQVRKELGQQVGALDRNGKQLYSAQQLFDLKYDFNNLESGLTGKGSAAAGGSATSGTGAPFTSSLNVKNIDKFEAKYKGTALEPVARAFVKKIRGGQLTTTESQLVNRATQIHSNYIDRLGDIQKEKLKKESDILASRMPELQTASGTLSESNKDDMDRVDQLIGLAARRMATFGALDNENKGDYSPDLVTKWRTGKDAKELKYDVQKKYDGSANLIIRNGSQKQVIPMSASDFAAYFPQYARTNPLNSIKTATLSSPGHTTNATGSKDASGAVNAYFSGYNLPGLAETSIANLVRLDVEGASTNDGSDRDEYQVRIYVNDNGAWKTRILNQKGFVNESGVQAIINGIGTNTISEILNQK